MTAVTAPATAGASAGRAVLAIGTTVSGAMRAAVDEALQARSSDPEVHAAALLLAFLDGAKPRLNRSASKLWMLGLDALIDAGHVEAAAWATPRLAAAWPGTPFLDNMAAIFRELPPASGPIRFIDDLSQDAQLVTVPGADTILVAFCGGFNRLGMSLNLIDRWFGRLGCHVLYLRDRSRTGYRDGIPALGADFPATVSALRSLIATTGASRVVCMGGSAGGTGALRLAPALGAERVLALSPITGGKEMMERLRDRLPAGTVIPFDDLAPLYSAPVGPLVCILYGGHNNTDRQQAERMAGLPNVVVRALPNWDSHDLVGGLVRAGAIDRVFAWLTADSPDLDLRAVDPGRARRPPPRLTARVAARIVRTTRRISGRLS